MNKEQYKTILTVAIMVGIFLILIAGYLVYQEISSAKKFCKSIDGNYTLKAFPLPVEHLCNNETFFKYTDGWGFDKTNFKIEFP